MCTAITFKTHHHYFGRNLDLERSYCESVVITPRNLKINMRVIPAIKTHYAIIGMAKTVDSFPLYFEATNEKGLSMASLNFPNNAKYNHFEEGKINITPFEFIPYILSFCQNIEEVQKKLKDINLINLNFSENLPLSPLHWIISDKNSSIVVESVNEGIKIYENEVGVLTNNPPFDYHLMNLNNYLYLHEGEPENRFGLRAEDKYSLGMGALGLPGDYSSASRFIRAAFVKYKSVCGEDEDESVNQFFHILSSVAMPKGAVRAANGEFEYTRYSCCINTDTGVYYYTTYENRNIKKIDMHSFNLDGNEIIIV